MTTRRPPGTGGDRRALVQPVAVGLLVVVAFVGTYLTLLLAPVPHDLRVAVAGPQATVTALDAALPPALAGRIELVAVPDHAAAEAAVGDRFAVAAYLPGDGTLLTAGAGGLPTAQFVTGVVTAVAAESGRVLQVRDLAPLPARDPRGLGPFYLVFGLVLAGFVFGQTNHLYGRTLLLRTRLAQTTVVSLGAGLLGAVLAGPLAGATAAPLPLVAGVLALLTSAVATVTVAATAVLGDAGVLVVAPAAAPAARTGGREGVDGAAVDTPGPPPYRIRSAVSRYAWPSNGCSSRSTRSATARHVLRHRQDDAASLRGRPAVRPARRDQ